LTIIRQPSSSYSSLYIPFLLAAGLAAPEGSLGKAVKPQVNDAGAAAHH